MRGHVDEGFLKRMEARLAKSGGGAPEYRATTSAPGQKTATLRMAVTEEGRKMQALEDLIVQTEIFLQYSLQARLWSGYRRSRRCFRGRRASRATANLYQLANWWPQGAPKAKAPEPAAAPPPAASRAEPAAEPSGAGLTGRTGVYTAETLRDLSKISEINQKIFRQQTPRAMLNTAVNEVGGYLRATRALAVVGSPGRPPELAAEYCAKGCAPRPERRWCSCWRIWKRHSPMSLAR